MSTWCILSEVEHMCTLPAWKTGYLLNKWQLYHQPIINRLLSRDFTLSEGQESTDHLWPGTPPSPVLEHLYCCPLGAGWIELALSCCGPCTGLPSLWAQCGHIGGPFGIWKVKSELWNQGSVMTQLLSGVYYEVKRWGIGWFPLFFPLFE